MIWRDLCHHAKESSHTRLINVVALVVLDLRLGMVLLKRKMMIVVTGLRILLLLDVGQTQVSVDLPADRALVGVLLHIDLGQICWNGTTRCTTSWFVINGGDLFGEFREGADDAPEGKGGLAQNLLFEGDLIERRCNHVLQLLALQVVDGLEVLVLAEVELPQERRGRRRLCCAILLFWL